MLRSLCYTGVGQAATLSHKYNQRIFISIFIFIFPFLLVFIFILIFISFQAGGSPPTSRIILGN